MTTYLDDFIVLSFVGLMVWAAVTDFRRFIIPNRICFAVLGLYPSWVLISFPHQDPVLWIASLILAFGVFACGVVLFSLGALGGGDVKLMTGVVLWAGPVHILPFFVVTTVVGLLLAVYVAVRTSLAGVPEQTPDRSAVSRIVAGLRNLRNVPMLKLTIPYGVAIAAGGLYVSAGLLTRWTG